MRRQQTMVGILFLFLGIAAGDGLRFIDLYLVHAIRSVILAGDSGRLLLVSAQITGLNTLACCRSTWARSF